jgi:hypothetical protein
LCILGDTLGKENIIRGKNNTHIIL